MSANVFLRVPGAAVSVDPTPPDGRTTRYGSRGHSRSPRHCPLPSKRWCWCDATCDEPMRLSVSDRHRASKRGEPLREGRLWRSRRKSGSRGEESLGRRRSRAGYPLADV